MKNEKFEQLMQNEEFVKEMLSQKSKEDVQKLYAANGLDLTLEDVEEIGKVLNSIDNHGELDVSDLDDVAGGFVITAATVWGVTKVVIGAGAAALSIYKWYKSR